MDEKKNVNIYNTTSFNKVRTTYILNLIFNNLLMKKLLEIIRYNKKLQTRLNKDINYFKKYLQIKIEIIPLENIYGNFINISNNNNYYHIYFNDNKQEVKRHYITEKEHIFISMIL